MSETAAVDRAALTQAVDAAWAKRLSEPTPDSFGIQYIADWSDYPDYWMDLRDWDNDDEPLRFATAEDALAWLDAEEERRFETAHASWRAAKASADVAQDLYERRKQCLSDNGLWVQDGEGFSPLIAKAGPGHEPVKGWQNRYQVVPDAEMGTPTEASAGQRRSGALT